MGFKSPKLVEFCTASGLFTSCSIDCTGTGLSANCSDGVFSGSCECGNVINSQGNLVVVVDNYQLNRIDAFCKYFAYSESKSIKFIVDNLKLVKNTYTTSSPFELRKTVQLIEQTYNKCDANDKTIITNWINQQPK